MFTHNLAHIVLICLIIFSGKEAMAADKAATSKPATADYTRPLSFEPNRGQSPRQVDFLAHGTACGLFLSHADALIVFRHDGTSVRMKPVGANASAPADALEQQPSRSNYFIGNIPERWHTDIPNYAKIRYRNVYLGIDLIYYGNQGQLEYDFVVSPGTDPDKILLDFKGAGKATLNRSGDLVMHTAAGDLRWQKPMAYQEINGERKLVGCTYTRKAGDRLAFELAVYDRSKPLIIDPVLVYSTYLGGSGGGDQGNAIAVDTLGNAYVTGFTSSADFPIKNAFQSSYRGFFTPNVFVSKFNSTGNLAYSTYLGGSGNTSGTEGDVGRGIAVDAHGNAYVTGFTGSGDFPTKDAFQPGLGGTCQPAPLCYTTNAFVTKLNAAGNALVYSTFLGGRDDFEPEDGGSGIGVDTAGNAYVAGFTNSTDFPTKNAFQTAPGGGFVTKFDAAGTALVYSTYFPASVSAIALDAHDNVYISGTAGPGVPTKNAFQAHSKSPNGNAFITKFDAAGTALVYSTYLGGSGRTCRPSCGATGDSGNSIAVDASGNAYVAGTATSLDFPTKNAFQPELNGRCYRCGNAFVTKLDAAGSALIYSTYLGAGGEQGNAIAVDAHGNAYVTGATNSPSFPIKNAFQEKIACEAGHSPCTEAFVTAFDSAGNVLVYSSYLGGYGNSNGGDQANGIAVDKSGNALVTGVTHSIDFPTKNAFQAQIEGEFGNAFVTKIKAQ